MKRFVFPVLLLALAAGEARAQKPLPPIAAKAPSSSSVNWRLSFKIRSHELSAAGNFTVADGAQSNYVVGAERPDEIVGADGKTGVEYKKHALIVNCVPARRPSDGLVDVQCQFELSGALPPAPKMKARPIETFQYQTDFSVKPGRALVLVDEPDRRVEVTLDEIAP